MQRHYKTSFCVYVCYCAITTTTYMHHYIFRFSRNSRVVVSFSCIFTPPAVPTFCDIISGIKEGGNWQLVFPPISETREPPFTFSIKHKQRRSFEQPNGWKKAANEINWNKFANTFTVSVREGDFSLRQNTTYILKLKINTFKVLGVMIPSIHKVFQRRHHSTVH